MKRIKSKIRNPFLLLLILIPLITLFLFNISLRIYINTTTKKELKATIEAVKTALIKTDGGNAPEQKVFVTARNILTALETSHFSPGMELYLLTEDSTPVFPARRRLTRTQSSFLDILSVRLPDMEQGVVYSIPVHGKKYLTIAYPMDNRGNLPDLTAVFALPSNPMGHYLNAINLILFVIMLLGVLAATYFSEKIASGITEPVASLGRLSLQIGQGNFDVSNLPVKQNALEFQQLYENICLMAAKLEAYDKTQKTFLQNASHELRTPLMSIQGYAEGIENGIFSDSKEAARIITRESIRLKDLVGELLTLSRFESGYYKVQWEEVNLCHVLKDYIQRLMGLSSKAGKELKLTLPDYDVILSTDDSLLSQVIINIVSNCLRYARDKVTITLILEETIIVLRIFDDGDGISENDLPHIFDRFYKGNKGNFGLGLAIAKSAAELLKGQIKACNGKEGGAVFEILLPENPQNSSATIV